MATFSKVGTTNFFKSCTHQLFERKLQVQSIHFTYRFLVSIHPSSGSSRYFKYQLQVSVHRSFDFSFGFKDGPILQGQPGTGCPLTFIQSGFHWEILIEMDAKQDKKYPKFQYGPASQVSWMPKYPSWLKDLDFSLPPKSFAFSLSRDKYPFIQDSNRES